MGVPPAVMFTGDQLPTVAVRLRVDRTPPPQFRRGKRGSLKKCQEKKTKRRNPTPNQPSNFIQHLPCGVSSSASFRMAWISSSFTNPRCSSIRGSSLKICRAFRGPFEAALEAGQSQWSKARKSKEVILRSFRSPAAGNPPETERMQLQRREFELMLTGDGPLLAATRLR